MSGGRSLAADLALARDCVRDARILLPIGSRNAAYLASQAARHLVRLVARTGGLHIERKDAHELDTTVRRRPDVSPGKARLASLAFLEAYATADRWPTPAGRSPAGPSAARLEQALACIESLVAELEIHHVSDGPFGSARLLAPRRHVP